METFASIDDIQRHAEQVLPQMVFDYYAGGAGDEWTLRENREAFQRYVLRPRVLVDVVERDTATEVLGTPVEAPIIIAPTAFQRMAHPEGEVATTRAAAAAGTIMTLSTIASSSIEEVAAAAPDAPRWFQLYVYNDRGVTKELVERAVASGYRALVLTVDTPVLGLRDRDGRNRFVLPEGVELANLAGLGRGMKLPHTEGSGLFEWVASLQDASVTWDDVAWLRSISDVPVVLKGILTAEDARLATDHGIEAIVVSNHGGRQLDGSPATISVLPEVIEAVDGRCEVYLDGGVRRGSDVLKAIALGARAVMIGRPVLWGLAADGERGVGMVLDMLRHEFDIAMAIAGCRDIGSITRDLVAPAGGP
ncbi:MAG: alpha-hydroxy acid oxidase [Actinomycetota bacterium]